MKKYLQYNASQFASQPSDAGIQAQRLRTPEVPRHDVLDLSGRLERNGVAVETNRMWGGDQESALDLSGYGRNQEEALDLSKPSPPASHPKQLIQPAHQSGRSLQPSPASTPSRSPASQPYSLLQAALNSSQPNAGLLDRNGQPLFTGLPLGDISRGIKPFVGIPSLPHGFSLPHMATSSGTVIHGGHKPIAITTPQPHNPPVNTKSQSVSDTTVSVTDANQSISSTSNQGYAVSQSNYSNAFKRQANAGSMGLEKGMKGATDFIKGKEHFQERYMLQNSDNYPVHMIGQQNVVHPEILNGFACTQCIKTFKTKAAMKLHMTVHKTVEERQYGCQVCGRRFLHRHHLVVHQRKHTGEKPFECRACNKTFMAIFLLHKHLRKHTRETGPVSEISIEQLKQLQEQKLINPGPQPLTYKNVPPLAMRNSDELVILSDGENASSDSKVKERLTSEIPVSKMSTPQIDLLTDTDKDPNGIVQKILSEAVAEIESEKAAKKLQRKKLTNEKKQENVVKPMKSFADKTNKLPLQEEITIKKEIDTTVDGKETVIDTEGKAEPVEKKGNPFPAYCSDDEVELDVHTGELKVVGKKIKQEIVDDNDIGEPWPDLIDDDEEDLPEKSDAVQDIGTAIKADTDQVNDNMGTDVKEEKDFPTKDQLESCETELAIVADKDKEKDTAIKTETCDEFDETLAFEITAVRGGVDVKEENKNFDIVTEERKETISEEITGDTPLVNKLDQDVKIVLNDIQLPKYEMDNIDMPELEHVTVEISETASISRRSSQDNIFEKMYEQVNEMRTMPDLNMRNRKGKKKGRKVKCEICSRTFHSNHYLLLHMAVHKRNPMLQSLKKAKANQMKALGFLNKINVACEICNKVFKFQKSLNSHMRVHSEKLIERKLYRKAFRDFVSGKPSNNKTAAKKEARVKSFCDTKKDSTVEKSKPHIEKSQSLTEIELEKLDDKIEDEPPIRVVVGEDAVKRYMCHACDNTYTTKQKLRYHALIHKDSCFLCDLCGKSFFRQITLDKHIATHKLPRPYICEVCKKSFIHRSSLMRHKSAHMKPSPPDPKQLEEDLHFQLKMKDTYSMLRDEQLRKQTLKSSDSATPFASGVKFNALDLTVKIKPEEQWLPPVLSPANIPNTSQANSCNLSPPLITDVSAMDESYDSITDLKITKDRLDLIQKAKQAVKRKPRTESGCSESDVLSSDGTPVGGKKSRKTRVYQTSCRVCKEVFPNVMLLKSHMVIHNTVETHLYECHICQHRFTQSCSLLRHLKTSCQENRMKCEPCNKTFHRRNTFEQHMKLHQGGTANLDGSFYDKRRDEAEVREERESDIENNNSSKVQEPVITPLTVENVTLFDQANNQLMKDIKADNDGNDTDSDARTYLYSEGEVHSPRSEPTGSENEARKVYNVPQDLTKNNMTLNLLSAVCSDIMNAEKEEEAKRKELEEKQKELETIEILANFKRGMRQKSSDFEMPSTSKDDPLSNTIKLPSQLVKSDYLTSQLAKSSELALPVAVPSEAVKADARVDAIRPSPKIEPSISRPTHSESNQTQENLRRSTPKSMSSSEDCKIFGSSPPPYHPLMAHPNFFRMKSPPPPLFHPQSNINTIIDAALAQAVKEPSIPTVVNESPSHEPPNQQGLATSVHSANLQKMQPLNHPAFPPPIPFRSRDVSLLQDLSKLQYPAIQERLNLLMKAQSTHAVPISAGAPVSSAHASHSTTRAKAPERHSAEKQTVPSPIERNSLHFQYNNDAPQDLTVKRPNKSIEKLLRDTEKYDTPKAISSRSVSYDNDRRINKHRPEFEPFPMSKAEIEHFLRTKAELEAKFGVIPTYDHRGRPGSAPIPPPLVNVFKCELCNKVIYNKLDHQLHMVEHAKASGLGVLSGYHGKKTSPLHQDGSLDTPIDFTKPVDHSTPKQRKLHPPASLELSKNNKSDDTSMKHVTGSQSDLNSTGSQHGKGDHLSTSRTPDRLSPLGGSEVGDNASSPLTPSGSSNLDAQLRQELRLKIYARRRSQGLDDLRVEFKSPEPTELTEDERLKLLYRRECNRQAAQRSRMRKKDLVDSLLEELRSEECIQDGLQKKMDILVLQKNTLLKVLDSHKCVNSKGKNATATLPTDNVTATSQSSRTASIIDHVLSNCSSAVDDASKRTISESQEYVQSNHGETNAEGNSRHGDNSDVGASAKLSRKMIDDRASFENYKLKKLKLINTEHLKDIKKEPADEIDNENVAMGSNYTGISKIGKKPSLDNTSDFENDDDLSDSDSDMFDSEMENDTNNSSNKQTYDDSEKLKKQTIDEQIEIIVNVARTSNASVSQSEVSHSRKSPDCVDDLSDIKAIVYDMVNKIAVWDDGLNSLDSFGPQL
ncbi:uncharacterized protein LOC128228509 isoform X1 [Mya arenaria]|uniref:uncharacterized protein LOC128228509 isoform X1 n=1 Tax=Mya arenaria TaxID=6604 RepID=UPI0022E3BE75|nr:uncharacterized protein LOC128228509 isoform X1 [Mya arenaria]XP_052795824.1 uncharacterized protein LOC128228509 isoform X1 [Mya arenaria]XP_052795833.1 uncharacterized protein LOC128228509 isoform X1 [Mya arenaria]